MKHQQKGKETAIYYEICSRVDKYASILMAFMKIGHIPLLLPVVYTKYNIVEGNFLICSIHPVNPLAKKSYFS